MAEVPFVDRSVRGFSETGKKSARYATLKAKAGGGDDALRGELLQLEVELRLAKSGPALASLARLEGLSQEQRSRILDAITNLEVAEICGGSRKDDKDLEAAARKLIELKKAGRLPSGEKEWSDLWLILMEFAEIQDQPAAVGEGLAALASKVGSGKAVGLWTLQKARRMSRSAYALYKDKKYAEAAAAYTTVAEAVPGDPLESGAAFFVACCSALAGRKEEALSWLERAVASGYRSFENLESDTDLASLRSEDRYKKLAAGLKEELAFEEKNPRQAKLGFRTSRITEEARGYLPLKDGTGVSVAGVTPKGAADEAGLKKLDVIVSLDGADATPEGVEKALESGAGRSVKLEILRKGRTLMIELNPGN